MKRPILIVGTALCALVVASAAPAKITKTVQVDCAKGQSIAASLEEKADELIVEISGVCFEDVVIGRSAVTLRGAGPGATIVGSGVAPVNFGGAVTVAGVSNVVLADLTIREGRRGVTVLGGGSAALERLTVEDSLRTGVSVFDSSFVEMTDCTLQRNVWGIAVWGNSELEFGGTIVSRDNNVGLVLSASNASSTGLTQPVEVRDNSFAGVYMQIDATAQHGVLATGNAYGLIMYLGGTFAGDLEARENTFGVYLGSGPTCACGGTLTDNVFGIFSENEVTLEFSGVVSGSSAAGMILDGTQAYIANSTVTDPVSLSFGTRVDFVGINSFTGGVSCDDSVLVRGDVSCPPPLTGLAAGAEAASAIAAGLGVPSAPLAPEP